MKKLLILSAIIFAGTTVSAQSHSHKKAHSQKQDTTVKYTCTMHPEIISDKPGKCPKCGMDLVPVKKEKSKVADAKTYSCPMHSDVVSGKPGNCSKCGMALNLSKKEKLKTEVVNGYACPMHADEVSDKPGTCPKCGMALTKKN